MMFLQQASNGGGLAERAAALYLLYFHLNDATKESLCSSAPPPEAENIPGKAAAKGATQTRPEPEGWGISVSQAGARLSSSLRPDSWRVQRGPLPSVSAGDASFPLRSH